MATCLSYLQMASAVFIAAVSASWIDPERMFTDYAPTSKSIYHQTVDHFSYSLSAQTFEQRYWIYDKFWHGRGPILFFFSGEGQLESFWSDTTILFSSLGPQLGGLIVFLEHRYYGESKVQNNTNLQYLTVEQALQDTAEFLTYLKSQYKCIECVACKTFVFGGSYGGMLVGWFRMKYPHLTSGGVVSSGSLDFYDIETIPQQAWENSLSAWYYEGGQKCYNSVKMVFDLIEFKEEAELVKLFNVCVDGRDRFILPGGGLPALIRYLKGGIASLSMIDYPFEWTLTTKQPAHPVKLACEKLANATDNDSLLSALSAIVADYTGPTVKCKNLELELFDHNATTLSTRKTRTPAKALKNKLRDDLDMQLWNYQVCTQVPMMPLSTDLLGFFVPASAGELHSLKAACAKRYNVRTREAYLPLTYGGRLTKNEKMEWLNILTRVVIVDGALDPWRTGSLGFEVQNNTSDFIVIPPVLGSAHHQDLIAEHPADSNELKQARKTILETLQKWFHEDSQNSLNKVV